MNPIRRRQFRRNAIVIFSFLFYLAGCAPSVLLHPTDAVDVKLTHNRESDICRGSLDRSRLGAPTSGVIGPNVSDPNLGPIAGFSNQFSPGADGIPCDRLTTVVTQGAVKFDVMERPELAGVTIKQAWLNITNFFPTRETRVVNGEPWDRPGLTGVLYDTTPRASCRFRVRLSDADWRPAPATPIPMSTLNNYEGTEDDYFDVPIDSGIRFLVTDAVTRWMDGAPEQGFVIEPVDSAIGEKSNSFCSGLFHVQLRIYTEE